MLIPQAVVIIKGTTTRPLHFLFHSVSPQVLFHIQAVDEGEEQEEGELVEVVPEPTDEELLTQLGLQLEQQMADLTATDELPAGIMQQWAEEELRRDTEQWQPRRQLADQDSEDEEDAAAAVSCSDIKSSMLGPCNPSPFHSPSPSSLHHPFTPIPPPPPSPLSPPSTPAHFTLRCLLLLVHLAKKHGRVEKASMTSGNYGVMGSPVVRDVACLACSSCLYCTYTTWSCPCCSIPNMTCGSKACLCQHTSCVGATTQCMTWFQLQTQLWNLCSE